MLGTINPFHLLNFFSELNFAARFDDLSGKKDGEKETSFVPHNYLFHNILR